MRKICIGIVFVSTLLSAWFQMRLVFEFAQSGLLIQSSSSIPSPARVLLDSSVRIGKVPLIPRDEFWEKRSSPEEIDEFFEFHSPSNQQLRDQFQTQFHHYWSCSSNKESRKVAFLHVRRSGGSIIHALLRGYATLCHAGMAIVTQCFDVGLPFLQGKSYWTNMGSHSPHQGSECLLRYLQERNSTSDHSRDLKRQKSSSLQPVTTNLLQQKHMDIVSGQIPMGIDAFWNTTQQFQAPIDMRYIIMIRDPLARYVSQFVVSAKAKKWTVSQMLEVLSETVQSRLQHDIFHETLSNSLITPQQRHWVEREHVRWTLERRVNISMANLVRMPVLVGRLDRLPETMRLIQSMMDPDKRLGTAYEYYSSSDKLKLMQEGSSATARKKSRDLVAAIRSNETLYQSCQEFLKYEYQIYNFASRIHQAQVD